MAHNTIGGIVYEICEAIWNTMKDEFIPFPTTAALRVEKEFFEKWKFPNCIGAVDGKHVRHKAPAKSGTQYYNYKKYFSVHLQAVDDAKCKFITVDVGEYGSRSDSGVFNSSTLTYAFKPFKYLCSKTSFGYYNQRTSQNSADAAKLRFNESLSIARRCVECAFGILVAKWRCLKTELQVTPDHVTTIIH
uniref:DDE Tnp4 domain-containing protein n=1 Tax=Anopheles funestus TaxID=62324 RepID=A0A182R593_ANOFN